jgi:DNA-binding HxlR family transcriptional regulator
MTRKYDLHCPVARTLNVVGDRWAILVLRDLFLYGPRRFQDFERSLKGITPGVLSKRLREFEAHGVIECRLYAEHPPRYEYGLTEKGLELRSVLGAMKRWGERYAERSE